MYAPNFASGTPAESTGLAHGSHTGEEPSLNEPSHSPFWTSDDREDLEELHRIFRNSRYASTESSSECPAVDEDGLPTRRSNPSQASKIATPTLPSSPIDELESTLPHLDIGFHDCKYYCQCGKSYQRQCGLDSHLAIQGRDKLPCPECSETFSTGFTLGRHRENIHGHGKANCPHCPLRSRPDYINIHLVQQKCKGAMDAAHVQNTAIGHQRQHDIAVEDHSPFNACPDTILQETLGISPADSGNDSHGPEQQRWL